MDQRTALLEIDATLRGKGFSPADRGVADYEGQIRVHGKPVDVLISVPDVRFAEKPRIYLKDRRQVAVEVLAHVESDTGICYASGAGLPIDLYKPGEAVLRVLEQARKTLELSYGGKGQAELVDEYQAYWNAELPVRCLLPRSSIRDGVKATAFFARRGDKALFNAIGEQPKLAGYETELPSNVIFWVSDQLIGPVAGMIVPTTLADLKVWITGNASFKAKKWDSVLAHLATRSYLFISAPNALVGFRIKIPADIQAGFIQKRIRPEKLPALLGARSASVELERFSGKWSSLSDVTDRNNPTDLDLSETSIALVGCGTIGSHLARMLVQCGAGNKGRLTLFDTQALDQGNIGRHLLGFGDIGKGKASAVGAELSRFHPQVKASWIEHDALKHLNDLGNHNLVIDATGEWNVQSALNHWFMDGARKRTKALLHSWVFMNGAGVQSFLNLNDEYACFRCLKPAFDGPWRFPVGNEKDELNLKPATCGDGAFVPFTVDAPVMAASLAVRSALDWVNGDPGPRLRSTIVDMRRGRPQEPRHPSPSKACPECADRRVSR
ncbi:E2/UBC family protein [Sphingobium sp. YR657]|uniref:E2/UBC family protein n=1 Tax=Sphingobium sp. YR657 TaxID=1884366 RepID=UPI0031382BCB